MPQGYPISKIYTVSYRPADGGEPDAAPLASLLEEFRKSGGRKAAGSVRRIEDGAEVRIRYKIKKGCFRWQKTSGGKILQKSLEADGGGFCILSYNRYGALTSKAVYGTDFCWEGTDYYYKASDGKFRTAVSLSKSGWQIVLREYGKNGAVSAESVLYACPVQEDAVKRSIVDNTCGAAKVYAKTDAGSFDFCFENEKKIRTAAANGDAVLTFDTPGEEKAALDFKYINNAVPDGLHGHEENAGTGNMEADKITVKETDGPACGFDFGKIPSLNEMVEQIEKQPVSRWTEMLDSCLKADCGRGTGAKENLSADKGAAAGNAAALGNAAKSIKDWSGAQEGRRTKYAVAAKGMSGVIIHAKELKEEKPPVEGLEENGLIPAKRIVITSKESYLYFGELINGLRSGRGRTQMGNGRTAYEGGYRKDKRDGFGVYYYKSGRLCYAGGWKQNLRDGMGVAFGADDGSVFVGHWERGIPTGRGSAFDMEGNLIYTGDWKNGRRDGYGTEYSGGRILRTGQWRGGEFYAGYSYKKNESTENMKHAD